MASSNASPSGANSEPPVLRRLLPASATVRPEPHPLPLEIPKRQNIAIACGACRKVKVKCDGGRPQCLRCVSKQQTCKYDEEGTGIRAIKRRYNNLKCRQDNLEAIIQALRSRSKADADAILQRIRNGDDIGVLAQHLQHVDLLLQPSLVPEMRYRYEFPLVSGMPAFLQTPTNPYTQSLVYEWVWGAVDNEDGSQTNTSKERPSGDMSDSYAPYTMPYHAANVIDAALLSVQPSRWTTVSTDNQLMRKLLAAFFLQDWSWYPAFHKDYFLEDMAEMSSESCSSLLVNVVLAVGCSYDRSLEGRTEFWNPSTLGYRFLAEAKRLWELAQDSDKLTTIQAGMIFNLIYNLNGADKLGFAYTIRSCQMAHRLGLFTESVTIQNSRVRNARNFTAWSLFAFQSLFTFGFYRAPLLDAPPIVALPAPAEDPQWYGEVWLRYPSNSTLYPLHFGEFHKARCGYEMIMNDLGRRLFTSAPTPQVLSAAEIANFYQRFRTWFDQLPKSLSSHSIVLPSALKLHMHYYQELLGILHPLAISRPDAAGPRTFAAHAGESPHKAFAESSRCLETLLRVYYLRHGFEYLDTYLLAFISRCLFMRIEEVENHRDCDDLLGKRSTIILMCKGIYDQSQGLFLGKLLFRLVRSMIRREELEALGHFTRIDEASLMAYETHLKEAKSAWPVDIIGSSDDPDAKRLSLLLDQYNSAV